MKDRSQRSWRAALLVSTLPSAANVQSVSSAHTHSSLWLLLPENGQRAVGERGCNLSSEQSELVLLKDRRWSETSWGGGHVGPGSSNPHGFQSGTRRGSDCRSKATCRRPSQHNVLCFAVLHEQNCSNENVLVHDCSTGRSDIETPPSRFFSLSVPCFFSCYFFFKYAW